MSSIPDLGNELIPFVQDPRDFLNFIYVYFWQVLFGLSGLIIIVLRIIIV